MAGTDSRRLVIDADVAARAGGRDTPVVAAAMYCREFLEAVLQCEHYLVMTPDIAAEWSRHQFTFARQWRRRMYARKRLVCPTPDTHSSLASRLERVDCTEEQHEVMRKDLHLIEAAKATDETIASCDKKAKGLFRGASQRVAELRTIVWVNPEESEEKPIPWLEAGAPPERHRMLGWTG
jgi:hypothetical protein